MSAHVSSEQVILSTKWPLMRPLNDLKSSRKKAKLDPAAVAEMDEEAQLAAAIKASLKETLGDKDQVRKSSLREALMEKEKVSLKKTPGDKNKCKKRSVTSLLLRIHDRPTVQPTNELSLYNEEEDQNINLNNLILLG